MPLSDLPSAWDGARVVHLSDLHYGNFRSEWLFRWTVETTNALAPDLILITGDFIMNLPREGPPAARHLAGLRSRHGVVAVLGDHDFYYAAGRPQTGLEEELAHAGVRLLRNDAVEIEGLRLAGTDPWTRKVSTANLERALTPLEGKPPHILLTHSPDMLGPAAAAGVPMMLAGHTHGGQVVIPGYGPPITHTLVGRAHASGWSRRGGTRLYTSRGLASHASLRFCCLPELTVFTLRSA